MAEVSVINQIAIHATAETAAPTLPSKGTSISQATMSTAGFETIGSAQLNTDDIDLGGDAVNITISSVYAKEDPARSVAPTGAHLIKRRVEPFTFVCDDAREALLTLDSNITVASNRAQLGTTSTRRTVIIEVAGLWIDYFPSCILEVSQLGAGFGEDGVAQTQFNVEPIGTSTYKGGWYREWYQ